MYIYIDINSCPIIIKLTDITATLQERSTLFHAVHTSQVCPVSCIPSVFGSSSESTSKWGSKQTLSSTLKGRLWCHTPPRSPPLLAPPLAHSTLTQPQLACSVFGSSSDSASKWGSKQTLSSTLKGQTVVPRPTPCPTLLLTPPLPLSTPMQPQLACSVCLSVHWLFATDQLFPLFPPTLLVVVKARLVLHSDLPLPTWLQSWRLGHS